MLIVFGLFIVFSISLLVYYLGIFRLFTTYKFNKKHKTKNLPVSVIICSKDEADNLKQFLPDIYAQDYPDFEVVLIDDRSIYDTFEIIQNFKEQYPDKTKIVKVNFSDDSRLQANKKYALTLGIKAASHNQLIFTDADCKPASKQWLQKIASKFSQNKQLILGYGAYQKTPKSFLNKVIRFETVQTALQYFSYALKGMPYMGVGRNLAYTKDLFMNNNGFYTHLDIMSGDDDLFVNEVANQQNTEICVTPDTFTISNPKKTWKEYLYQKRRHISTAKYYKTKHKLLLAWYYISLLGFWITGIVLLINKFLWPCVLGMFIARLFTAWYINYKTNEKLQEKDLSLWFPVLEIYLLFLQLYIYVRNLFKKPDYWTT
jgi:glycosyltransferase involved in cell wall biosynthesis